MKNLLSMKDLSIDEITTILNRAEILKQYGIRELPEKYMISNLFFEPSTRTKMSFEIAERKLGLDRFLLKQVLQVLLKEKVCRYT